MLQILCTAFQVKPDTNRQKYTHLIFSVTPYEQSCNQKGMNLAKIHKFYLQIHAPASSQIVIMNRRF